MCFVNVSIILYKKNNEICPVVFEAFHFLSGQRHATWRVRHVSDACLSIRHADMPPIRRVRASWDLQPFKIVTMTCS